MPWTWWASGPSSARSSNAISAICWPFRLGPAAAFYAFYIVGVLYFVSVPALRDGAPVQAALAGALLGLMCYGTYEFTSLAIMRDWSWQQVIADTAWGGFLTGFSAWAGVMVARMVG